MWPITATIAAVVLVLLMVAYLSLPGLVSRRLADEVFRRLGLTGFSGRIIAITPYHTIAGPFALGAGDRPAVRIGRVEIGYTPQGLFGKTIDRVRIGDVTVDVVLGSDGVAIPGLDLEAMVGEKADRSASMDASSAPLSIERVEIRSGLINLHQGNLVTKIPFDADLVPESRRLSPVAIRLGLFPRDQQVRLGARVDVDRREAKIDVDASTVALDALADLIHRIPRVDASGTVGLRGSVTVGWGPVAIADAHADLYWHGGRVSVGASRWVPGADTSSPVLSATFTGAGTWQMTGGGVRLEGPVPVHLEALRATIQGDPRSRLQAAGSVRVVVPPFTASPSMRLSSNAPIRLPLTVDVALAAGGRWNAVLATPQAGPESSPAPLRLGYAGARIRTGPPIVKLTAAGEGQGGQVRGEFTAKTIQVAGDASSVDLPSIACSGDVSFSLGRRGLSGRGTVDVLLPTVSLDGHGLRGQLTGLAVSAGFRQPHNGSFTADGRLRCTGGRVDHLDSHSQWSGLRLDLPWGWNTDKQGGQGTFIVKRITLQGRHMGTIAGRLMRGRKAYTLDAAFSSPLLPTLNARISGSADRLGHADLALTVPDTPLPKEYDLGRWFPPAKGATLSGTLSARAKAVIRPGGLDGALDLSLTGAELALAEKKIVVTGIDATLRFPELPRIRSEPAQQIRFSRAVMGGIVVEGGGFDIQVESDKTLLVEKGRLAWCGGRVDVQSLRIVSDRQDYDLTLYCQHLGLSRILEQLGAVNASGSGTVNGRIPIAYRKGKIRFDDGFLFSTPGEGGRIRLSGTEILTRGIPIDTPQFAQMDLAREALEDYQYDWARLGLTSEGEDLVMRLRFDGKPAKPLPFVYSKELGRFVRVDASSPGSRFQGIGLDVNLRLPLNRLLQYKDRIQTTQ